MGNSEETQGEDLIADFLEEKDLEFKRYYKILDLKEDYKSFREADFYLPKYNIFIEFLGKWDNPEDRSKYKQKMAVYHKNKIPCIYLWPDNLGTLDWIIKRRIREALLKYNKKMTLLKYEFKNYLNENGLLLVILGFLIYYVSDIKFKLFLLFFLVIFLFSTIKKYIVRLSKLKKSKWVSGSGYNTQIQKS